MSLSNLLYDNAGKNVVNRDRRVPASLVMALRSHAGLTAVHCTAAIIMGGVVCRLSDIRTHNHHYPCHMSD